MFIIHEVLRDVFKYFGCPLLLCAFVSVDVFDKINGFFENLVVLFLTMSSVSVDALDKINGLFENLGFLFLTIPSASSDELERINGFFENLGVSSLLSSSVSFPPPSPPIRLDLC